MNRYLKKSWFPPFLSEIVKMDPEDLPISAYARILCQNCGLFNRAILCPPLLYQTYPQYSTLDSSRKHFSSYDEAYVYVFKNDGTKRFWYKKESDQYSHLRLRKAESGRQLKGMETVSVRYLTKIMHRIRVHMKKQGFVTETFIPGHCDLCARKCPNRENPPCERKGLPSLEATGINVYALLDQLGIEYEYPVESYLTSVTLMVRRKK